MEGNHGHEHGSRGHAPPSPPSGTSGHGHEHSAGEHAANADHGVPGAHPELHGEAHAHEESSHAGGHAHSNEGGLRGLIASVLRPHSHDSAESFDTALASTERGIWALKLSLLGLGATALLQVVVVFFTGSVALLADTIHNFSDALTAVPLWMAFALGRRPASRRYTYGFGRAEDLAGVFIVTMIALSAVIAGWESIQRLLNPRPIDNLEWVMAAGIIGFLGNEAVALFRIRVGRDIGSAALVADGYHARTDGLTSLAVVAGAVGVALGFPRADALVGLGITAAILFVLKNAVGQVWQRLMDAADPILVGSLEQAAAGVSGVQAVHDVRARWLGHRLEADLRVVVDEDLPLGRAHEVAEGVRHALFHAQPKLQDALVHVDPCGHAGHEPHAGAAHHAAA